MAMDYNRQLGQFVTCIAPLNVRKCYIQPLMSRIERKYCLISTSYLAGLFDMSYSFIFDRIECVLVTFYQ